MAARQIIDPLRVGLIGWSHSGFLNYYAVTHPGRMKIVAAIADDSTTFSYGEFVLDAALRDDTRTFDFFRHLPLALEQALGFNVDRTSTPMLFTVKDTYGEQSLHARDASP